MSEIPGTDLPPEATTPAPAPSSEGLIAGIPPMPEASTNTAPQDILASPWAPPAVPEAPATEVVKPNPVEPIGPAPGVIEAPTPQTGPSLADDYTEVAPMFKHAEVPKIGGPGSEDNAAMIAAAAKPPEGPRYQM